MNVIETTMRLVRPLGWLIKAGYFVGVGWWLDRLVAKTNDRQLRQDVLDSLGFLFPNGASVEPIRLNDGLPPFDYATVTLAISNILLSVTRGRGSLSIEVASRQFPKEWHDLRQVLTVLGLSDRARDEDFRDLWQVASLLQNRLGQLDTKFSEENYTSVRKLLADSDRLDRVSKKEAEWELNTKLRRSVNK